MRIAEIVPSLEERQGGPSKSVLGLSSALAGLGHDVSLLATEVGPGGEEMHDGLRVGLFRRDWPQRLCPSRALRRRLGELEAEVVHHHSVWLRTLHYAHREAAARRVPLVISPRGMLARWTRSRRSWRKRLARLLIHPGAFADAAGWHATSEQEAEDIRRCGFPQPICVAPNGVEIPGAEEMADSARAWHEAYPQLARQPVALFYSRFHRKKRLLELIDLWLEQGPRNWLLLIAGIPQEYSEEGLSDYVLRASGNGRVLVASGLGRPPPYAAASLFLLPSHDENFGQAIAEALASGVPALVTDTTPWQGLNARGGWCVPWEGYASALRAATGEGPAGLRARGGEARAWIAQEYSWQKPARLLGEFYQRLGESATR